MRRSGSGAVGDPYPPWKGRQGFQRIPFIHIKYIKTYIYIYMYVFVFSRNLCRDPPCLGIVGIDLYR